MAIGDSNSLKFRTALSKSTAELSSSFEKLASGKRINRAKDDAAGLAIVAALESGVKTTLQGARNAVDGVSVAAIAESALGSVSDITVRQQELAAQSANGTLSDEQRTSLDTEFQALEQEKSRIINSTSFNGVNVFNSSGTTLQVGTGSDSNSQISLPSVDTSSITSSGGASIASQAGAQASLESLKTQGQNVTNLRGQIGSVVSRLEVAETNNRANAVESEAAASRIRDVDIASETANLTASRIRQQGTTALAAQSAKLSGDTVLQLLR